MRNRRRNKDRRGTRAALYTEWLITTLPVFDAMMFGATLGANATLIGASANIVSAGIFSL